MLRLFSLAGSSRHLHLRSEQAIFSHESALLLHHLTDREPAQPSITVRTGYNPSKLAADGIQVYTVKKSLHGIGKSTAATQFGHQVPVYDIERTICEIVRSRNRLEYQVFQEALKSYVRRPGKKLIQLMQYASQFNVEEIVRKYVEVLL
jgi:predicted transcriptional regulator of viral defense system